MLLVVAGPPPKALPMPSPMHRARFATGVAILGIFVMGLFFVLLFLLVLLYGIAGVTGSLPFPVGFAEVATYLAVAAAVAWWGWTILRDLRCFRVVDVDSNGTWILRNPLGFVLGRIERGDPRRIDDCSQEVWMRATTATQYTRSWVKITAGDRTWRSCCSIPRVTSAAARALRFPPFV